MISSPQHVRECLVLKVEPNCVIVYDGDREYVCYNGRTFGFASFDLELGKSRRKEQPKLTCLYWNHRTREPHTAVQYRKFLKVGRLYLADFRRCVPIREFELPAQFEPADDTGDQEVRGSGAAHA